MSRSEIIQPEQRKVIVAVDEHMLDKYNMEGLTRELVKDDVYYLEVPFKGSEQVPAYLKNIRQLSLAKPGSVLIQSPYNSDRYSDLSEAALNFSLEKYMHFSSVAQLLGAKRLSMKQLDAQIKGEHRTIKLNAQRLGVGVDGEAQWKAAEIISQQLSLEDEFEGGEADVDAAQHYIEQYNLISDSCLTNLAGMRGFSNNKLKTRTLSINLTSETQKTISIAANINFPKFLKISGSSESALQEKSEYSLTVIVEF